MAKRNELMPLRSSSTRTPDRSLAMKVRFPMFVAVMLLCMSVLAVCQEEGKIWGSYQANQSAEFGGRITGISGNENVYNTFVNLHDGPRLLDYTLSLRSLTGQGSLFDSLYLTNFGYGGDPLDLTRLRIQKNKKYDFSGSFRRDVSYFNYNTVVNPLNYGPNVSFIPGTTTINPLPFNAFTTVSWNNALHLLNTRRKMGELNLTIAPESPIRLRLGWNRNYNRGPSFSSFHEGTDIQLFQDWANRQDEYHAGVDVRLAPRTTLSYDQYYTYGTVNTNFVDGNVGLYFINSVSPANAVDIGAIYYPYYGQPCTNVSVSPTNVVTPTNCGIWGSYTRVGPSKVTTPTEQLSFTSNYWKKLDISAVGTYSSATSRINNYLEQGRTLVARNGELGFENSGPTRTRRIMTDGDFGLTYHINDSWAISDKFNWYYYRIPGKWNSSETICFPSVGGAATNVLTPFGFNGNTTCAGQPTVPGIVHVASSPADFTSTLFNRYIGERRIFNTTYLQWDPTRRFGAEVGFRYGDRNLTIKDFDSSTAITVGPAVGARVPGTKTTATDEVSQETIHSYAALVGIKARPTDEWLINADGEFVSNSNQFEPIAPRNQQRVKVRSSYRMRWGTIAGSLNALENRNSVIALNPDGTNAFPSSAINPRHQDHYRAYTFGFTTNMDKKLAVDFGYSYNDIFSSSGTCLMVSGNAPTSTIVPLGGPIARCSLINPPGVTNPVPGQAMPAILDYASSVHNGYFNLIIKPVKRVTMIIGYDLTSDQGKNQWLRADTQTPLLFPIDQLGNVIVTSTTVNGVVVPNPVNGQVLAGYAQGPNPWAPISPLNVNWHKPSGQLELELVKNVYFKGAYNFYEYDEKTPANQVVKSRFFRANVGTLSLKYAF